MKIKKLYKLLMPKNLPNFIVVGAQKSGTTSIHYYLGQHPKLIGSSLKELNYFNRDLYFGKNLDNYKKAFKGNRNKFYFESSPSYLYQPNVAKEIHKVLPDIKLIVLLRDPVKRAYSAWNHYRQYFNSIPLFQEIENMPRIEGNLLFDKFFKDRTEFPTFRECINIELALIEQNIGFEPSLLRRGLYLQQLETYWQYFNKEQIMIIGFKDLLLDIPSTLKKVTDFVGVQYINWENLNLEPKNTREYSEPMNEEDRLFLEDFFRIPNQELFDTIGKLNW
ncbi:MAG: sulfotransferase [Sulfuricurvum sp.]|nr:sulfotransferase [Sulfuricurvum sp.]